MALVLPRRQYIPEEPERESIGQEFLRGLANLVPQSLGYLAQSALGPTGAVGEGLMGTRAAEAQEAKAAIDRAQAAYLAGRNPTQEAIAERQLLGQLGAARERGMAQRDVALTRGGAQRDVAATQGRSKVRAQGIATKGRSADARVEWETRERIAKMKQQARGLRASWRRSTGRKVSDPKKMFIVSKTTGRVTTADKYENDIATLRRTTGELSSVGQAGTTVGTGALGRQNRFMDEWADVEYAGSHDEAQRLSAKYAAEAAAREPALQPRPTAESETESTITPYGQSKLAGEAAERDLEAQIANQSAILEARLANAEAIGAVNANEAEGTRQLIKTLGSVAAREAGAYQNPQQRLAAQAELARRLDERIRRQPPPQVEAPQVQAPAPTRAPPRSEFPAPGPATPQGGRSMPRPVPEQRPGGPSPGAVRAADRYTVEQLQRFADSDNPTIAERAREALALKQAK